MTSNDPEQIRRDIEETRANLSNDVNALADEANPANVAKRQVHSATSSVKEGAQSLKEKIMGSDDQYDNRGHYDQSVGRGDEASYAAGHLRARAAVGGQGMNDRASGFGDRMGGRASDARASMGQAAGDARQTLADTPNKVRRGTQGNPLAAGLIAFGVGALIGGLAPASRVERRAVSELADRAEPLVDQAKQQAGAVAQEVKENLSEPVQEAVQNVKDSATDSADNLKSQGQSHAQDLQGHAQDAKGDVQQH